MLRTLPFVESAVFSFVLLLGFSRSLHGLDPGESTESSALRIHIGWYDPELLFDRGCERAALALEAIFQQMGVVATMERSQTFSPLPKAINLRVLLVPHQRRNPNFQKRMLGATTGKSPVLGNEDPPRMIFIFFTDVLSVIGYKHAVRFPYSSRAHMDFSGPSWGNKISQVLARIIAHETIHAVVPDIPHTETGLMCGEFSSRNLLAPKDEIDPLLADRFRREVAIALWKQEPIEPIRALTNPDH